MRKTTKNETTIMFFDAQDVKLALFEYAKRHAYGEWTKDVAEHGISIIDTIITEIDPDDFVADPHNRDYRAQMRVYKHDNV